MNFKRLIGFGLVLLAVVALFLMVNLWFWLWLIVLVVGVVSIMTADAEQVGDDTITYTDEGLKANKEFIAKSLTWIDARLSMLEAEHDEREKEEELKKEESTPKQACDSSNMASQTQVNYAFSYCSYEQMLKSCVW
jgi:hypothetical protein